MGTSRCANSPPASVHLSIKTECAPVGDAGVRIVLLLAKDQPHTLPLTKQFKNPNYDIF